MPITPAQLERVQNRQHGAAHDARRRVRLIAGPGTGKSVAIEERVRWLVAEQERKASEVFVVSFTRASALELRDRIRRHGRLAGADLTGVSVSTLHSLALRILRAAGVLGTAYPVPPSVLDAWEQEHIFDAEFASTTPWTPARCKAIRRHNEAFWSTGSWTPANYLPPDLPVSDSERRQFAAFHRPRTQLYACVLPGEMVKVCVDRASRGLLDPAALLGVKDLIVDEFQDLNPYDQKLVDVIGQSGVRVFVAGDDDQSIYSFRFASPAGIQDFVDGQPDAGDHTLEDCFRCTPAVAAAATELVSTNPVPNRIAKRLISLYAESDPPIPGTVHRWRFRTAVAEAAAIASSCRALLDAGMPAREILILISNRRLEPALTSALTAAGIRHELASPDAFIDTDVGRALLSVLRAVANPDDYIAYRTLLGMVPRVGPGICQSIAARAIADNLNYRDLFRDLAPLDAFTNRQRAAIEKVAATCTEIVDWSSDDSVEERSEAMAELLVDWAGAEAADIWADLVDPLPAQMTLGELRDFVWADRDEQQADILRGVFERLAQPEPDEGVLPPRVRLMTMHGAKGLGARVVFIPGLEAGFIPNARQQGYAGLVLEAARLLYVSLSRARVAAVVSYAEHRTVFGTWQRSVPSPFAADLGGIFRPREVGLSETEAEALVATGDLL